MSKEIREKLYNTLLTRHEDGVALGNNPKWHVKTSLIYSRAMLTALLESGTDKATAYKIQMGIDSITENLKNVEDV